MNQVSHQDQTQSNNLEAQILATTSTRRVMVTSWDNLKTAAISKKSYAIQSDDDPKSWPESIAVYKRFRQDMMTVDAVALYKGRVIIPVVLHRQVLASLHQAHQGTTGMNLRTWDSVWWLNITAEIDPVRVLCNICHKNAPTQSPLPPVQPPTPEHPFQLVSSDYFLLAGHNYLVIVDRYGNWPVVVKCRTESAEELITLFRDYFCTYGVPLQITSDGNPTYMSDTTQQFLKT